MASRPATPGTLPLPAEADVALLPVANPILLTTGIMLASLLQILDTTIANVAIPHMQAALGATPDTISWALTSYIVATAVAMPLTGWLADRFGSRNLFIVSVAGFILSSMLCGLAQNLTQMVIFRALQGATGAFISPLSQAAMIDTNKPSRQAQMMAIWGMGIMIGPILGPFIGGWLTENWNWRWVFFVNVPLGAVSLAIMLAELPSRPKAHREFDMAGFLLIALLLGSLQMLLDRGNHVDWFDAAESWIYAGLAVATAWMATIHFTTAEHPLFRRELFANPNFLIALMFMLVIGLVMFATMALLPPMLQHLFGYSVMSTGEAMVPRGIGTLISMQLSGMLVRRGYDSRVLVAIGFAIAGYSLWQMSGWSLAVDRDQIMVTSLIQGLGIGLVFIPLNAAAFNTLPPHLRTEGSSLLNLARSMGASVGIAVTTAVAARSIQVSHADLAGHVTASASTMIDMSATERFQELGEAALRLIDAEVIRQAAMIAYVNDFYLMAWLSLAAAPLAVLLRKQAGGPQY